MKRPTLYITAFVAALISLAALGIGAAVDTPRTLMSRADYNAGKSAIEADAQVALSRCRDVEGSAKDICKAEARAQERMKKADLKARYHGTVAAAEEARLAHAQAAFDLAKARCGIQKGDARVDCLRSARQDQGKALEPAAT